MTKIIPLYIFKEPLEWIDGSFPKKCHKKIHIESYGDLLYDKLVEKIQIESGIQNFVIIHVPDNNPLDKNIQRSGFSFINDKWFPGRKGLGLSIKFYQ